MAVIKSTLQRDDPVNLVTSIILKHCKKKGIRETISTVFSRERPTRRKFHHKDPGGKFSRQERTSGRQVRRVVRAHMADKINRKREKPLISGNAP